MKAVGTFFGVALVWSWGLLAWYAGSGGQFDAQHPEAFALAVAYMWGPGVGAIVAQHFVVKKHVPTGLGLSMESKLWLVGAWLLAPVIALGVLAVTAVLPDTRVTFHLPDLLEAVKHQVPPEHLEEVTQRAHETSGLLAFGFQFTGAMLFGTFVRGFVALGEELGWRGFLLKELAPHGFWRTSLVIGLMWGLWYAPLIAFGHNFPDHPQLGVLLMFAFTLIASPLVTYVRLRAGSVAAAALFIGGLQAAGGVVVSFTLGGDDLTRGVFGLPGLLVLFVAMLVVVLRGLPQAREALDKLAASKV